MQKADGMNYAPESGRETEKACGSGEFPFGVVGLDHGHIYGMCNGLVEAGATLSSVWDPDPAKTAAFAARYPQARIAAAAEEILEDGACRLVASAIRPDQRGALGLRVLERGKHFFVDKPGLLTLSELEAVREACGRTGKRYFVYFSERLHVEGAVLAETLIAQGTVGRVLHVDILAPHRLNKSSRPDWFFRPELNGGILLDIGSHQAEQFLAYSGGRSARVSYAAAENYGNPDKPDFRDFGECCLRADNGATCHFRVDWFTPGGLRAWGDGRVFIVGTRGTLEIRKYLDLARSDEGDRVLLADSEGEREFRAAGTTGFPFFGRLIRDCLAGTETAIGQEHSFEAMRLAVEAQAAADANS